MRLLLLAPYSHERIKVLKNIKLTGPALTFVARCLLDPDSTTVRLIFDTLSDKNIGLEEFTDSKDRLTVLFVGL